MATLLVLHLSVVWRAEPAYLEGANLEGANLRGANLSRAQFQRANLLNARYLTQAQLDQACGDEMTQLPEGLEIKTCEPDESSFDSSR